MIGVPIDFEFVTWLNNLATAQARAGKATGRHFQERADYEDEIRKLTGYETLVKKLLNFSALSGSIQEAVEDYWDSIILVFSGHYKAGFLMLRAHYELMVALLGATRSDQQISHFKDNRAKGNRCFSTKPLCVNKEWNNELDAIYNQLSKFAHADGMQTSTASLNSLPEPIFQKSSFDRFWQLLDQVIQNTSGLIMTCFPENAHRKDLLKDLFGKKMKPNSYEAETINDLLSRITTPVVLKHAKRLDFFQPKKHDK